MRSVRWGDWPASTRIAAACLAGALVLDLAALVRMRHVRADETVVPIQVERVPRIAMRMHDDGEIVRQAALRTPFDIVAPTTVPVLTAATALPNVVSAALPRLVGTVVEGRNGGFVVVELPDARMQLVRVGERAGELKLRSVAAGEAVFDDPHGTRVSLKAPRAGSGVEPRP